MRCLIATGLFFLAILFQSCKQPANIGSPLNYVETPTGLRYRIERRGRGEPVKVGSEVLLHEKMSYRNDSLLFDSRKLPGPIKVLVGGNQVIKGIDEGLVGMKKGEVKKLIIPPSLSKRMGVQTFPHPDSTLVYEIELIEILKN